MTRVEKGIEQSLDSPAPQPEEPDPVQVTAHEQDGGLVFDWQQPGWDTMLDGLQQLRNDRLVRPLGFGVSELEIPIGMLTFLKRKYPDLDSKDGQIKTRAWKRFLASSESKPFRTRGRGRFLNRSVGGIPWQDDSQAPLPGRDVAHPSSVGDEPTQKVEQITAPQAVA